MATIISTEAQIKYDDSDERNGDFDVTLGGSPVTVSPDLLTAIDAYALTGSGTDATKFTFGQVEQVKIIITIEPASQVPATFGDIRSKWNVTFPSGTQRSVPARNTAGILTTAESQGEFADKTQPAYTDWFAALFSAPPAGLGAVDPADNTSPSSADLEVRATTSTRARPRV